MKNKIFQFTKQYSIEILIFLIIFIALAIQHSVIGMYFDDYGNASLSYGYLTPNVAGTNYTIPQLFEWANNIYNTWGGRILYAIAFIIPLLKNGISSYMGSQVIVIMLIFILMYKIIKYNLKTNEKTWIIPVILFVLYACINMKYLRHGIYWASASVLYIWPLLPLFAFMYFYQKICDDIKNNKGKKYVFRTICLCILSFLAAFSQEQIGVALISYIIFYILFHHVKNIKKYLKIDIPIIVTSIVSYLLLFLAPGNFVRLETNENFAKLSFLGKIYENYPKIIDSIFYDKMFIFIFITLILMIYIAIKNIKKAKIVTKRINCICIFILITQLILMILCNFGIYSKIIFVLVSTACLITMFYLSLVYFSSNNKLEFCAYEVGGVCSVFCTLMSPVVGGRTGLPFMFYLILIMTLLIVKIINNEKGLIKISISIILLLCSTYGLINYGSIYLGYRANYPILKLNDEILRKYKSGDSIKLYKVKNSWFGSTEPYEEESMYIWIKEYYDIPHDVDFIWEDIYDGIR